MADRFVMGRLDRASARRKLHGRDPERDRQHRPKPDQDEGTDLLDKVQHIVILMMENHSFDNYFGKLGRGDGLDSNSALPVNRNKDGNAVPPWHLPKTKQQSADPTQTWNASHIQYGDGQNDGFVGSIEQTVPKGDSNVPMGYFERADLPFYYGLAETFALADRWFCSLLGPTFPNRRFLTAATANGLIDDVPTGMVDYPATGTIFDLLDRNEISWVNYHHVSPWKVYGKRVFGSTGLRTARGVGLALTNLFPQALRIVQGNMQFTADLYPLGMWRCLGHLRSFERFLADAAAGKLPSVSIVDPNFQSSSEENPQDVQIGEGFAAAVINAVMNGPAWGETVLIWLYDEHGGYFDHVAPPPAPEPDKVLPKSLLNRGGPIRWVLRGLGDWTKLKQADSGAGCYDRYGFRVPAVVVSPFSKPGYVCSVDFDHTSVLKLIERKWNLPPLTARDAAATAPLDMFDFDHPAFLTPPKLPEPAVPWTDS